MDMFVADEVPEEVPFELVVFERDATTVTVTVRGMTSCRNVEAVCYEAAQRTSVLVVGTTPGRHVRPYELRQTVDVAAGQTVSVHGLGTVEKVIGSVLPEDLPVVCGADPMLAGLAGDFLHKRGDRYVLMASAIAVRTSQSARVA